MQLLYRINRTGTTVVVATHDKRDGRPHAPPRDRAVHGRVSRRGIRPLRGDEPPGVRVLLRGSSMRFGFFFHEALRALTRNAVPSFAAMATVLVTVLVLGVFIPVVQATTGAANEVRSARDRRRLPEDANAKPADVARVRGIIENETPHVKRVEFVSKEQALRRRAQGATAAPTTSCSAPTRCRTRSASLPTSRTTSPTIRNALAPLPAVRRAHGRSTPRSTRSATARRTRTRSSPPRAS